MHSKRLTRLHETHSRTHSECDWASCNRRIRICKSNIDDDEGPFLLEKDARKRRINIEVTWKVKYGQSTYSDKTNDQSNLAWKCKIRVWKSEETSGDESRVTSNGPSYQNGWIVQSPGSNLPQARNQEQPAHGCYGALRTTKRHRYQSFPAKVCQRSWKRTKEEIRNCLA